MAGIYEISPVNTIRLAHLSDPHLFYGLPKGAQWLSKRGLSALSWLIHRRHLHKAEIAEKLRLDLIGADTDTIVVSGDLVNFSLEEEFGKARAWLESLGPSGKVIVLPGNHEALTGGWQRRFERHWGDYAAWTGSGGPTLHRVGPAALIAVSTALATPPFLASGRVGERQSAAVAALVRGARREGLCPLVVMHHPPTPIVPRRKGLSDHKAFATMLADEGAALVLHGHCHRADLSLIGAGHRSIPVLGIPSFSMDGRSGRAAGCWRMIKIARADKGWDVEIEERACDAKRAINALTPIRLRLY